MGHLPHETRGQPSLRSSLKEGRRNEAIMSLRSRFFAATYDRQMTKTEAAGLGAHRQRVIAAAAGDVLEIGGGTGANLHLYGDDVRTLTITEPEVPMLR